MSRIAPNWLSCRLMLLNLTRTKSQPSFQNRIANWSFHQSQYRELLEKALAFMNRIASLPEHVAAYFKHPAAAYAIKDI
ncbi:MAG: hypothetical protein ACXV8O_18575 [Methylobacter sp.]